MVYSTDDDSDCDQKPVPTSSRGGLGNIRARKQSQANVKDTTIPTPKSPSTKSSSSSGSTSPSAFRFRRVLSVGSNSTVSSASSVYSNVDSLIATIGSGSGAASVISGLSGTSGGGDDYDVSEPGSPLSPTFPSSASNGTKGKTTSVMSTSAEYALHLQTDARQRALEKQHAKAREKEMEAFSRGLDDQDGEENPEEKVVKLRSGRGGAGVYKTVEYGVDPTLHPCAAVITQEYEARAAAHAREIIAASRMRASLKGSTGRGGAGNVGAGGKRVKSQVKNSKKSREVEKGKGKARADVNPDEIGNNANDRSLDGASALEGQGDDDATVVHVDDDTPDVGEKQKKGPRFRKLFRRAIRSNNAESNAVSPSSSDNTPRQSMGDSILEIKRPSSPSPSFPSVASTNSVNSPQLVSPSHSSHGIQGSAKLRKQPRSRGELREGAELLSFVNAALPDFPGARNVLGVPGTPGFPLPGGRSVSGATPRLQRSQTELSSRSSTPVNNHSSVPPGDPNVHGTVPSEATQPGSVNKTEGVIEEEEWVDDDTLHEVDEDEDEDDNFDDEEGEDSDIDPQMIRRASKKEQQFSLPQYDYGKHDSLDVVIRVALDKLDRTEIKDKKNLNEDGIIDAYAFSNDTNIDAQYSRPQLPPPHVANQGTRRVPPASPPPLTPAPVISPSTPRYVRASAPVLPARLNPGSRITSKPMQKVIGSEAGGKLRVVVPLAGPPPARPVPRLPDQF
ncbi:hypothetical protein ACEPAF_5346 [Sanghuangporus sanghuang]